MKIKVILLLCCTLALCSFSYVGLSRAANDRPQNTQPEMLYLPSGKGLELVSFGYRNALAHFLWFHTNNYFGKHYRGDRDYGWLSHYCKLVIKLNPKSRTYYEFCGMMLAWEAGQYDESLKIYTQAIEAYPQDWLYYYLRGFVYTFFLKNDQRAKDDFMKSATLPDAHHIVARLASKKILAEGNVDDAEAFLGEAIEMATNPSTKSILENRLKQIRQSKKNTESASK